MNNLRQLNQIPKHRPLKDIALEIARDWHTMPVTAQAYYRPLLSLNQITDNYILDSGSSVVRYFLANAQGWRGEKAREIKTELKKILKLLDDPRVQEIANQNVKREYARG